MKWTKFPGLYSCHIITHDLLQALDAYRELVTGCKKSYYRLYSPCASYTTVSLISKLLDMMRLRQLLVVYYRLVYRLSPSGEAILCKTSSPILENKYVVSQLFLILWHLSPSRRVQDLLLPKLIGGTSISFYWQQPKDKFSGSGKPSIMLLCHKPNNKYILTVSSLGNVTLSFQMLSTRTVCVALFLAAMWNCFHSLNHTMIEIFREHNTETDMVRLEIHQ